MKKPIDRIVRYLTWYAFWELKTEIPIFIVDSGRSGTTWLEEVINHEYHYRIVFEPFHGLKGLFLKDPGSWQYMEPDAENRVARDNLHRLFYGNYRNRWTDSWNHKRFRAFDGRCIKTIRSHTFIGFLRRQFPEVKIIYLMRHPLSVIGSWKQRDWPLQTKTFLIQESLMSGPLAQHRDFIDSLETKAEFRALRWAVENFVGLQQLKVRDAHVVFYEHLCVRPELEIERLKENLGIAAPADVAITVGKPATHSQAQGKNFRDPQELVKWRNNYTEEELDQTWKVVSEFGLDAIYSRSDAMPTINDPQEALTLF